MARPTQKTLTLPSSLHLKGEETKSAARCFDPLSLYSKGEGWGEGFLLVSQEFILALGLIRPQPWKVYIQA